MRGGWLGGRGDAIVNHPLARCPTRPLVHPSACQLTIKNVRRATSTSRVELRVEWIELQLKLKLKLKLSIDGEA